MVDKSMVDKSGVDRSLREQLIAAALRMNALGINQGRAGNVSQRAGHDYLITPTGLAYEETTAADIVRMDMAGNHSGARLPSSEWRFHRDIYRARPELHAIVHTHAPYATTLACMERGIPAFHYMVAVAGGKDIACAPYATFGSQALSDGAVAALAGRRACLLAHHGMIAAGASLQSALELAVEVEALAGLYWRALQIGTPKLLPDEEMVVVLEKFRTYGQGRH